MVSAANAQDEGKSKLGCIDLFIEQAYTSE
jgi:hypothetical protein